MIRVLALFLLLWPGLAQAACRQALALGLDVSGSVDAQEYRLQLDGLATALSTPAVQEVLFAQPDAPVHVLVYEWSGPRNQRLIVPWTAIDSPAALAGVTATLRSTPRGDGSATTAIGAALRRGFSYLAEKPDCWKRTLDLSGDGENNNGSRPQDVGADELPTGVVVNGLVIGTGNSRGDDARFADIKELSAYYRGVVIRGPGAFVETALGFTDYARAMERKLLRELTSLAIGQLDQ